MSNIIHHTFILCVKAHIHIELFQRQSYLRLRSLQSGCCRDLHKASTPLSPIVLWFRFTSLNSDWPEHKAADNESMDAAVNLQPCSLQINRKRWVLKKRIDRSNTKRNVIYKKGTHWRSCSLHRGLCSALHSFVKPWSPMSLKVRSNTHSWELPEVRADTRSSHIASVRLQTASLGTYKSKCLGLINVLLRNVGYGKAFLKECIQLKSYCIV